MKCFYTFIELEKVGRWKLGWKRRTWEKRGTQTIWSRGAGCKWREDVVPQGAELAGMAQMAGNLLLQAQAGESRLSTSLNLSRPEFPHLRSRDKHNIFPTGGVKTTLRRLQCVTAPWSGPQMSVLVNVYCYYKLAKERIAHESKSHISRLSS